MTDRDRGADDRDETRDLSDPAKSSGDGSEDRTVDASADKTLDSADATIEAATQDGTAAPPTKPPETTALPERIGTYPIERELGRGGMGVVYVATDPSLERRVALKLLPHRDRSAFARFQSEAKLLAAINNPNIATIFSLEESDDQHFLTMELIAGESLDERIKTTEPSVDDWLSVCRQIAVALEAAHRNGIVHLDLKPQNVMVTPEGVAKVLDFGLAMALGAQTDDTDEARTRGRALDGISGTPGYMSPEQIRRTEVDSRADIWAFGCILYECVCRRHLFPGKKLMERLEASLEAEIDLAALPEETPGTIRDLLAACLVREVEHRLDTITKARRTIEQEIALRSLPTVTRKPETVPNNLPVQLASFIGREAQKKDVRELLTENRLLTLTGVGGGGKTRLSIEVGRELLERFSDGVWLVELAPLGSPDLVPRTVASVMKLKDEPNRTPTDLLLDHLKGRSTLLILDNCEHVLSSVADLTSALLASCPDLRVLATSRENVNVQGEVTYQVPSLAVPRTEKPLPLEELRNFESVRLFTERAGAANPSFVLNEENAPAVGQICRRLDGIPLAVELAAARIKVLPAEEIAKRLDNRFRLLTSSNRTAMPHHQTLRALIDWSYDHLTEAEQILLQRLSLFSGGWTLDAAEEICAGDGIEDWEVLDLLSNLVDKSLAETDAEGGEGTGKARYRMLETIREYARDRLVDRKEGPETLKRHRDYFLKVAEEADLQLMGREAMTYLLRLSAEHDNLRLALDMCLSPEADPELGWRLAGSLGRYFYLRGHWHEGRKNYAQLLERPDAPRESAAAANVLNWAGNLAKLQGDNKEARSHLEESLAIRRAIGDERGVAASLINLANVIKDQEDYEKARRLYEESLELQRKIGNQPGIALGLNALGVLAFEQRDYTGSLGLNEEALALQRKLGNRAGIAASLNNLGAAAEALGEFDRAAAYLEEGIGLLRELGNRPGIAASLVNLGSIAEKRGDLTQARKLYEEGLATWWELGDRRNIATTLNNLGLVLSEQGERERAKELLLESLTIFRELNDRATIPSLLCSLGTIAAEDNDPTRAVTLFGSARNLLQGKELRFAKCNEEKLTGLLEHLRVDLGHVEFDRLWGEGSELSLEAIIALAAGGSTGPDEPNLGS